MPKTIWFLVIALIANPGMLLASTNGINRAEETPAVLQEASPLAELCTVYSNYDRTKDGQVEIASLRLLASQSLAPQANEQVSKRMVLLVEQRLLDIQGEENTLLPALQRWAEDLANEGYVANVIAVDFAFNHQHRDGEYLLALREFLRELHRDYHLEGVVLVGRFPDAYLVRTCNWNRRGNLTLHKKTPREATYHKVNYVRRVPEVVAQRADIVLSDLDGRWEDVYVQQKTEFPSILAVFEGDIPVGGGECLDVRSSLKSFSDCFHVADGTLEIIEPSGQASEGQASEGKTIVRLSKQAKTTECTPDDLKLPNPMAQPEITVSRVNAAGIAWSPRNDIVGVEGKQLLDADGQPQAVQFASKKQVPNWRYGIWRADPQLELRLLTDYFDRNHDYRTGTAEIAWRPSAIACDLPSGYRVMRRAAGDWERQENRRLADVRRRPQLPDFVDWINYPAILRTIRAHTFPQGSQFRRGNIEKLDEMLADSCWSWTPRGDRLEPSLLAASGQGMLNWFLLRSLWQNNQVAEQPAFYHHTGCDALSPFGAGQLPFTHKQYGRYQSAEALLLFGNGLALVGRAKVFFDEPRGFAESLRRGDTFGNALGDYFAYDSGAKGSKPCRGSVGRKRAYFWSVLGDCSLRLKKTVNRDSKEVVTPDGIIADPTSADPT